LAAFLKSSSIATFADAINRTTPTMIIKTRSGFW